MSSQDILFHHASEEEGQCKNTNIPGETISSSLPEASPKEDLRGQPQEMTTAGSNNNMSSEHRVSQFSIKEGQGKDPMVKQKEARPPLFSSKEAQEESPIAVSKDPSPFSPDTRLGHLHSQAQNAPRAPFRKRVWKSIRRNIRKGLGRLCCCVPKQRAPSQEQNLGCDLKGLWRQPW